MPRNTILEESTCLDAGDALSSVGAAGKMAGSGKPEFRKDIATASSI